MTLGCDTTTTTTTGAMMTDQIQSDVSDMPQNDQAIFQDSTANPTSHSSEYTFDASQCLFCNQSHADLDCNLQHMSKIHGLQIDPANLLVDLETLLAYLHFVISEYYECLYCGTQRSTRQAVQQHMMGKGHCRYDLTNEEAEIRDFYDTSSSDSDTKEDVRQRLSAMRASDNSQLSPKARLRRPRPSKRSDRHTSDMMGPQDDQALPTTPSSFMNGEPSSDNTERPSHSLGALSARALKQEVTHDKQLSRLRANDLRSLMNLPVSQQRALLATHHKQMEKGRRTEQVKQSNLERAGNHTNCLGKIRLVRKPPHTGNVHSLNR
ncbi:hypothetical protein Q7P37_005335 [Cladosporium fusiforme]